MDVDSTVSLSSKITSSSSVSAKSHPHAPPPGPLQAGQESHPAMRDFFGPPPPPPPTSRTAGEAPPITTANCSSESLPHVKNDTREKSGSSSSSSSSTSSSSSLSSSFSFESSNQIKPSSSSSATSMMARANLSSSVSLFPTNSTTPANHRPVSQSHRYISQSHVYVANQSQNLPDTIISTLDNHRHISHKSQAHQPQIKGTSATNHRPPP